VLLSLVECNPTPSLPQAVTDPAIPLLLEMHQRGDSLFFSLSGFRFIEILYFFSLSLPASLVSIIQIPISQLALHLFFPFSLASVVTTAPQCPVNKSSIVTRFTSQAPLRGWRIEV
jgi:hypothetical protein